MTVGYLTRSIIPGLIYIPGHLTLNPSIDLKTLILSWTVPLCINPMLSALRETEPLVG